MGRLRGNLARDRVNILLPMRASTLLRHAFLPEAGGTPTPFTLQYFAGHDNIDATRYVHSREAGVTKLFIRVPSCSGRRSESSARRAKCGSGGTGRHTIYLCRFGNALQTSDNKRSTFRLNHFQ
jgi:hypothetical protein